jgi:hypothetical protein
MKILHVFEIAYLFYVFMVWNIEEDTMEHEGLERRST